MKRRIDSNISDEDEDANYKDYSYPRMIMTSGHDSTVSADLIFLLNALELNETEIYDFPRYASQLALEVRTNKTITSSSSYKDYYVKGYLDDKEIFEVNANDFITKVQNYAWSEEKINEFCGFDETNSNSNNNSNSTIIEEEKSDKAKTAYKVLMSIFICLSALLLASTIYFAYKLSKVNKTHPPLDKNETVNRTNVTESNINYH